MFCCLQSYDKFIDSLQGERNTTVKYLLNVMFGYLEFSISTLLTIERGENQAYVWCISYIYIMCNLLKRR